MCGVTRRGSSCAHCRNIYGVFNCFWLRSVGRVWVKPIRRLEETVKDCLRKRGYGVLVGRQTVDVAVCCRARMLRLLEHTLCLYPSVCMWVLFCLCERPSALWVQGKKMSYGISDYMSQCFFVQYLAFFFPPPTPWNWKPMATTEVSGDGNQTQNSGQTWKRNRGKKQCRETSSPVLCDFCGAWISPIVLHSQNTVSGWREKRLVKCTLARNFRQFVRLILLVCVSLLCHWDQTSVFLLYLAFLVTLKLKDKICETDTKKQNNRSASMWHMCHVCFFVELMLWIKFPLFSTPTI